MDTIYQELVKSLEERKQVCFCVITESAGSVPRRAGSKMLVYADGRTSGIKEAYALRKGFDTDFSTNELIALEFIQKEYVDWLIEMEAQTRSFSPFKLELSRADEFVKTLSLWNKGNIPLFSATSWERVTKILNETHSSIDEALTKSQKFLLLFSKAAEKLLTLKTN